MKESNLIGATSSVIVSVIDIQVLIPSGPEGQQYAGSPDLSEFDLAADSKVGQQ